MKFTIGLNLLKIMKRVGGNLLLLPLLFSILMVTACSTQYREGAATLSDEDLNTLISELIGEGGASGAFMALSENQSMNTQVYHAGSGPGRPAPSVLGLLDMKLFDYANGANWPDGRESRDTDLIRGDAVFIDTILEDGSHIYSLGLRMEFSGSQKSYFSASSNGRYSFTDDTFEVELVNPVTGDTFVLYTNDVSERYNDELAEYVRFDIYHVRDGYEVFVGQISTMANYSYQ